MSLLVVGLSHRTSPMALLERAALDREAVRVAEGRLGTADHVAGAVVLSTCNRVEVYADVSRFHGGVSDVGRALAAGSGLSLTELTDHLYVHYEDAAVAHLFGVASGLDSMAVGETQILGQLRAALRAGQEAGTAGRVVGHALQQALRVARRVHAETGLGRAGVTLVEAGLDRATETVGPVPGLHVLVLGAGSMSGLAAATATRQGAGAVTVVSRTLARAQRLARSVGGVARPMAGLPEALAAADVVITCAGAVGHLVDGAAAQRAAAGRGGRPQVYVDLALPRDVDPAAAQAPWVSVVDLENLGRRLAERGVGKEVAQARAIVAEEVTAHRASREAEAVAPTVVALRAHARTVVEAELARLESRLGDVDGRVRAELARTVHRVVEKLLHTPTVRIKELAAEHGADGYAEALRELFDLDLDVAAPVLAPEAAIDPHTLGSPR